MLTFKVTADATALDDDATDAGLDVNEVPTAEDMLRVLTESVNTGEFGNTLNRYASATDASPSLTTAEALDLQEAEKAAKCLAGEYICKAGCCACPAGAYSSMGSNECSPCPAGTYTKDTGATICTKCAYVVRHIISPRGRTPC